MFIIVDTYDSIDAQTSCSAVSRRVNPPEIDTVEVYLNEEAAQIGVRVTGSDPEKDVVSLALNLYDEEGDGLLTDSGDVDIFPFNEVTYVDDSTRFVARTVINLTMTIPCRVSHRASDDHGNLSNLVEATGTQTLVQRGK